MRIESKRTYLLCLVIFLLSAGLLFSNNIWFDESYTCALIEHSYSDMISILKDDMHPPLYFVSLKFFTGCFGNSFVATKIFSLLGLFSALLLGCMLIRKQFWEKISFLYSLFLASVPMMFYFSVQQRCFSWCMCWRCILKMYFENVFNNRMMPGSNKPSLVP